MMRGHQALTGIERGRERRVTRLAGRLLQGNAGGRVDGDRDDQQRDLKSFAQRGARAPKRRGGALQAVVDVDRAHRQRVLLAAPHSAAAASRHPESMPPLSATTSPVARRGR